MAQNWSWPCYYCLKFTNCMVVIIISSWKERETAPGSGWNYSILSSTYHSSASPRSLPMWQEAVIETLARPMPATDKTRLLSWCSWPFDICPFFIFFFELGDVRLKAYVGCLYKENHDQPAHINYRRSCYFLLARTNLRGCGLRSPWQGSYIVSVSRAGFGAEEFCISALPWCNLAHLLSSGCITSLAGITVKRGEYQWLKGALTS